MNESGYRRQISFSKSARDRGRRGHECHVVLLGDVVLAMDFRIARQGSQCGGCDPARRSSSTRRVARQISGRSRETFQPTRNPCACRWPTRQPVQIGRQVVPQPIVDIQIEVEAVAGYAIELTRAGIVRPRPGARVLAGNTRPWSRAAGRYQRSEQRDEPSCTASQSGWQPPGTLIVRVD